MTLLFFVFLTSVYVFPFFPYFFPSLISVQLPRCSNVLPYTRFSVSATYFIYMVDVFIWSTMRHSSISSSVNLSFLMISLQALVNLFASMYVFHCLLNFSIKCMFIQWSCCLGLDGLSKKLSKHLYSPL